MSDNQEQSGSSSRGIGKAIALTVWIVVMASVVTVGAYSVIVYNHDRMSEFLSLSALENTSVALPASEQKNLPAQGEGKPTVPTMTSATQKYPFNPCDVPKKVFEDSGLADIILDNSSGKMKFSSGSNPRDRVFFQSGCKYQWRDTEIYLLRFHPGDLEHLTRIASEPLSRPGKMRYIVRKINSDGMSGVDYTEHNSELKYDVQYAIFLRQGYAFFISLRDKDSRPFTRDGEFQKIYRLARSFS